MNQLSQKQLQIKIDEGKETAFAAIKRSETFARKNTAKAVITGKDEYVMVTLYQERLALLCEYSVINQSLIELFYTKLLLCL